MSKRYWKALSGILLGLGMVSLVLLTTRAAGEADPEWSTDTFLDFCDGTMNGVDVWSEPGTARLDRDWWANVRVNDDPAEGKVYPRLSFVLTNTVGTTETHFLVVWEDERVEDHYPDIYFDRSTDGGRSWSADIRVSEPHQSGRRKNAPDITVRLADESFWVVWQDNRNDDGDIYYSVSHDQGSNWDPPASVYTGTGTQLLPRIVPHGQSGYLYAVWEDERDDDGDIYISRYNPDVDLAWSTPVKVSDVITPTEQRNPNLTVDADGNVYVVWEELRENDDGEIYFSRWISGTWGTGTWSANSMVSDPAMDWANAPDIVAGPGGVLFAAWYERVPTGPATYDFQIVVARSVDSGDTWSRSVVRRLSNASASNASYRNPAIGVDLLGKVYVAWIHSPDQQAATSSVLFSLSPDGGGHWTEPRVLSRQPRNKVDISTVPGLVTGFDGEVVVAWSDYRDGSSPQIYATGYPADNYLTSGEYNRTFDAGGPAAWGTITWTATITPNTGLQIATRVMTTAGAGWTDWFTHTASGDAIPHPSGRLIRYRAVFTSTALPGNDTSVLDAVVISYEQYRVFLPLVLREG
jgi:hypothetical protein